VGPAIPLLALLGMVVAFVRTEWRPAVALGLASLALLFISAALVGNVSRYRYPVDPMLTVLAVGGLAWVVERFRNRRPSRRPPTDASDDFAMAARRVPSAPR